MATLASGLTLMWLGRQIDRVELRLFTGLVLAGFTAACFLMAWAPAVPLLGLALFGLRLGGQGLMTHIAFTSMARYFDAGRGKALSFVPLGHALGEVLFPLLAVAAMAVIGWRLSWVAIGLVTAGVMAPLLFWLLRGQGRRHALYQARLANGDGHREQAPVRHWSRGEVVKDPRFWLLLPAVLASSFIITGIFFHQVHLVETKGWTLAWFASGFVVYAGTSLVAALAVGPAIDRAGAGWLIPLYLVPLGLGLLVLTFMDAPAAAMLFMLMGGLTAGTSQTVTTAMWAELYGTLHLGAIRALIAALSILASALSPVTLGALIDLGVSMEALTGLCFAYVVAAIALVVPVFRREVRSLLARVRLPARPR